MKTKSLHAMFVCLLLAILPFPAFANDADGNPEFIDEAQIKEFFLARLNGEDIPSPVSCTLKAKEVEGISDLIWSIWAVANSQFDEEQLPEPKDLAGDPKTKEFDGTWRLGNEDMHFYYGFKGEKPDEGYPLFICLHGSGGNDHEIMANLSWAQRYEDVPSLYFIPRSPQGGTGCRWYQPTRQQTWERVLRQSYLSGNINPDRVYIFGISEGAYGSQRLASFYADYLAGAGPIAGGEQMFWAPPENCASIAFCLQTGELDTWYGRKLLTEKAKREWVALQQAHPGYYEHKIDLQPGKAHGCTYIYTTPYLKQFSRNPYPKYLYWENLALGNINGEGAAFRHGFYNLWVKERSTDDSDDYVRSCYEMTIEGNTVNLNVNVVTVKPSDWTEVNTEEESWKMNLGETKTFEKATSGKVVIYLNDELVDLSKPVTVNVNGERKFKGRVKLDMKNIIESCAGYFDPQRLYPAAVEVTID